MMRRVALRTYRWLLYLLPVHFRAKHGTELERCCAEAMNDGGARGWWRAALSWLGSVGDLIANVPRVYRQTPRRSPAGWPRPGPSRRRWGDGLGLDVRHAVRSLLHTPAFTFIACATLMLGIGANAALFSVVYGVLVQPLPFPEADRLVLLWGTNEGQPTRWGNASLPNLEDWKARSEGLESIAGYTDNTVPLVGGVEPVRVEVARHSP